MHSPSRGGHPDQLTPVHNLAARARRHGHFPALAYYQGDGSWPAVTYAELYSRAVALADVLRGARRLAGGERFVLVALPPGIDYVVAFYACLVAGSTAVTFYPPSMTTSRVTTGYEARLRQVFDDCDPSVVVAGGDLHELIRRVDGGDNAGHRLLLDPARPSWSPDGDIGAEPATQPEHLALLQYTSGSTSAPRGVMVRNSNLVHNISGIARNLGSAEGEAMTGWLPLHHDMGLIGMVCHAHWAGATLHMLPPAAFIRRPFLWLDTISRTRSTFTVAPNFAYDTAVRRVRAEDRESLDLSCLRHALNGAEPVRRDTIERFVEAFAPHGFDARAMMPVYGMAEATLCISCVDRRQDPVYFDVSADRLRRESRAVPRGDERGLTLVGCGHDLSPDNRTVIVDPDRRVLCPAGTVGEIWVCGPSVAGGYWGRPEETEETFAATLPGDDRRFLRTGDLGVKIDGVLCIVGRTKDVIIRHGANHAPHDIEATAEESHQALLRRGGVVFAVPTDDGAAGADQVVLVHELVQADADVDHNAVISSVRRAVAEVHGLQLDAVALVPKGRVPRTTSGKVQRRASLERWLAGEFHPVAVGARDTALRGGSS